MVMNSITQSLILTSSHPKIISVRHFSRRQAGNAAEIAVALGEQYLGLSVCLSTSGEVGYIAVATPKEVFLIAADSDRGSLLPRDKPFRDLLSGETSSILVGFEMARLAIQIGRDLETTVNGVDLGTLCSPNTRNPWRPGEFITKKVCASAKSFEIDNIWGGGLEKDHRDVCLRAWISKCAAESVSEELQGALKVDTRFLDSKELHCLGQLVKQADLLEAAKPKEVPNDFASHKMAEDGTLSIINARYRTRVRKGNQTTVIITDTSGQEYSGQPRSSAGKTTGIKFSGSGPSGTLASVRVVGRQDLTNAEKACNEVLLFFLRREKLVRDSVFTRMLWFPSRRQSVNTREGDSAPPPAVGIPLNESQLQAVQAMVSESPMVIIHGPPGTGKTTTISAAASIWDKAHQNAWIVAHSNVAVKNIAEKLVQHDVDFKLIVSKEFHFEWHEHIYTLVEKNLIRTDELPKKASDTQAVLGNSCIVLSTLSTLSNPALMTNGLFEAVPVERLVIDEASQIKTFDFMSIFAQFTGLKKVSFFGDPKQLPPYGQETVPGLQTIFDITHLQGLGHFLNIQYRMPVPIGNFISTNVYDGGLQSEHAMSHMSCVSFVNVLESVEVKEGFSWKNSEELRTIVHLVRNYYQDKDFCIITPYDAQRAAIERALKGENLPWECVFNVDSFQGNEAKFVLISVVRSTGPGFMTSLNRMNVMLTRCQAGLVVVTSRSFMHGGGMNTLLGRMAQYWEEYRGDDVWVEWKSVASEQVDLPGAPGRNKTSNPMSFPNRLPATVSISPQYIPSPPESSPFRGWSETPPVAPANNLALRSSTNQMSKSPLGGTVQSYQNYDEIFPSLQALHPSPSTLSPTTSTHSFLPIKAKPIMPSSGQLPENAHPASIHPSPVQFPKRAPADPKASENQWQPVTNSRRTRKYTLTQSGYKL